ncbi:MAG: CcmD family protein [Methanosarcinales archaeon]
MNSLILAFAIVWILLGLYILKLYLTERDLLQKRKSHRLVK